MGLSNLLLPGSGSGSQSVPNSPTLPKNLGQRMGSYFEGQYPLAGGLAQAVFGNNQNQQQEPSLIGLRPPPSVMSSDENEYDTQDTGMAMLQSLFGQRMR